VCCTSQLRLGVPTNRLYRNETQHSCCCGHCGRRMCDVHAVRVAAHSSICCARGGCSAVVEYNTFLVSNVNNTARSSEGGCVDFFAVVKYFCVPFTVPPLGIPLPSYRYRNPASFF
jgi:hypothetical protein